MSDVKSIQRTKAEVRCLRIAIAEQEARRRHYLAFLRWAFGGWAWMIKKHFK